MAVLSRRQPERQRARRAELEARLLDAVEGLLAQGHSYADLRVAKIAASAGISRTTFYGQVGDKRQLLLSLGARLTDDLVEAAAGWNGADEDGGASRLRELLRLFLNRNRERPLLGALTEAASYDPGIRAAWLAEQDRMIRLIEGQFDEEVRAGRARADLPVRATACALYWMTQQTCYQELVARQRLDDDEYLDALAELWLRGIRRTPDRPGGQESATLASD
jgi:AcrR family transcriptional regulator